MTNKLFKTRYRIPSARAPWHDYRYGTYFVTICTKNREHSFGEILNDGTGNPIMRLTAIGENADECWREIPSHFPHVQTMSRVIMPNHIHGILTINPIAETQNVVAYYDEMQRIADVVETQNVAIHGETQRISDVAGMKNVAIHGETQRITDVVETQNVAIHDETQRITDGVETQNFASLRPGQPQHPGQPRQPHHHGQSQQTGNVIVPYNRFGPQSKNLASVIRGFKIGVTKFARRHNIPFEWQPRYYDHIIRDMEELDFITDYIENNVSNWEEDGFYG